MAMHTHAARLMVHHAAGQVDVPIRGNSSEPSMAKCWAGDTALQVAPRMPVPVERFMRDAKIMQVYEAPTRSGA